MSTAGNKILVTVCRCGSCSFLQSEIWPASEKFHNQLILSIGMTSFTFLLLVVLMNATLYPSAKNLLLLMYVRGLTSQHIMFTFIISDPAHLVYLEFSYTLNNSNEIFRKFEV
jgi:hypothetical protein